MHNDVANIADAIRPTPGDVGIAAALGGGLPSILDRIHDASISLCIWWRDSPAAPSHDDLGAMEAIHFTAAPATVARTVREALGASPAAPWHHPIADDAGLLAIRFATIMQVDQVEVRLEPIATDACWKFHTDYVRARLITTYAGPGTQWRSAAAQDDAVIHQLRTGDVGVFKGRNADRLPGVVHRSPPIGRTGERRLLLVIDPIPA